jgi:hypothetical protein
VNGDHAIGCDLANVYEETDGDLEYRTTLAWGDRVELLGSTSTGMIGPEGKAVVLTNARARFFAFERAVFGIVKLRTDGRRLFVWTNSGQQDLKESYAFESGPGFQVEPVEPLVAT